MKSLKTLLSAIWAGICIAMGGTVFLSAESRELGALLFTVGLFTICVFGLDLFTGKVCYTFENGLDYAFSLPLIWLGNLAGCYLTAFLEGQTRIGPALAEKAAGLCKVKLNDGLLSSFILAVFCNILIYTAVEGYKNAPYEVGKYLSLFFGVSVFILCGFEHCVANMYYFSMAGIWSGKTLLYILVITAGNAIGGVVFPLARRRLIK